MTGLLGEGGVFRKEEDGKTYLEADRLYVRMKAYFDTVEIRRFLHSNGNRIASGAGAKCVRVEYIGADGGVVDDAQDAVLFRCYFRGSDGDDEVTNDFVVGDQAYCHVTNGSTQALQQHHYWRLIVGRNENGVLTDDGEHWIDLSNRETETLTIDGTPYTHAGCQSGSDIPVAQDDIIQLGNISDTTRQGAIIEFVSGADAPSYQIFQGIDDFSLTGKNYVGLGYSSQTGRAYMNVYGDAYIGDRNGSTYMQYHIVSVPVVDPETGEQVVDEETGEPVYRQEPRLDIKARINVQSTVSGGQDGDQSLEEYINSRSVSKETIMKLIGDDLEKIQQQIDGAIMTWYYQGVPTLSNAPANTWNADGTEGVSEDTYYRNHVGDLYYDKDTGYAYRFLKDGNTYKWELVRDTGVTEALGKAQEAKATADGKRRVFVSQPTPPYEVGDLWVNATFPAGNTETDSLQSKYYNDMLKCVTAKRFSPDNVCQRRLRHLHRQHTESGGRKG